MLPQNYNSIENPLIGIDLNIRNQLDLLSKFHYNEELERIPHTVLFLSDKIEQKLS